MRARPSVLEDVTRLQAAGIPLGWVLLDNPWETVQRHARRSTAAASPTRPALIRQVHARGVRFMLWVSPKATCGAGLPAGAARSARPSAACSTCAQPAVVAEFRARLRRLVALGVDGVKGDRGDEVDLQSVSPTLQNEYPLLFARAVVGALPRGSGAIFRAGDGRARSRCCRGCGPATSRSEFVGLQRAIVAAQTAAMSGFPTWGSDVGGYNANGPPLTAELFARWAQLGAVSPVLEVGGAGRERDAVEARPRRDGRAPRLRPCCTTSSSPLFTSLLRSGEPVLRPLAYGYPGDAAVLGRAVSSCSSGRTCSPRPSSARA